ncbi:MAG: flavodoxin [Endomicrobia bacterium]|nr:flavodoxin [Endomicrobiia bacterium]MCL2506154.1 flavodoxin [Endomicrobiia bacterium]
MKKIISIAFICAALTVISFNYALAENTKKILIAYYSHSGNTAKIAKQIQKYTGGDLFEIKTIDAYPAKYNDLTSQAKKEISEGFKPTLASKVINFEKYDIIFVGSPNWWSTIAPPVASFLSEYDFSGKTIIPFCTHGGGGIARCFDDMKKLQPNANFLEGKGFYGSDASENEISKWLKNLNLK